MVLQSTYQKISQSCLQGNLKNLRTCRRVMNLKSIFDSRYRGVVSWNLETAIIAGEKPRRNRESDRRAAYPMISNIC